MVEIITTCEHCNRNETYYGREVMVLFNTTTSTYAYRFVCKYCDKIAIKPLKPEQAAVLYARGVEFRDWSTPQLEVVNGPRLKEDDLINIMIDLADSSPMLLQYIND